MQQNKYKDFLDSITKIKKLFQNKKNQEFHPGMLMTMKIIYNNCLNNKKDTENYYGMKTSELTKNLCITKPATSKMLNVLEDKGYIERTSSKCDRRVVYVRLTKEGEEFLEEENKKFENFTYRVMEKMGEEDTENLIRLFRKLYNIIEELNSEK